MRTRILTMDKLTGAFVMSKLECRKVIVIKINISCKCAAASVPDSVKAELLQRIKSFLMSASLW